MSNYGDVIFLTEFLADKSDISPITWGLGLVNVSRLC
jgi:hypothetical protein